MSTIEIIFTYGVGPIITIIGTWVAFKTKQKKDADKAELIARKSELENVEKAIKIWSDSAERLEKSVLSRDKEIEALKIQLNEISSQNKSLLQKLNQLEKDYSQLDKNYKELKKELSK